MEECKDAFDRFIVYSFFMELLVINSLVLPNMYYINHGLHELVLKLLYEGVYLINKSCFIL